MHFLPYFTGDLWQELWTPHPPLTASFLNHSEPPAWPATLLDHSPLTNGLITKSTALSVLRSSLHTGNAKDTPFLRFQAAHRSQRPLWPGLL